MTVADQFAPNHKLCYRCQGSGRERGVFYGKDPGDCMDCGGKGVVFKGTPPPARGVEGRCNCSGIGHNGVSPTCPIHAGVEGRTK
jgi:DnaJ-class molecular chaperone